MICCKCDKDLAECTCPDCAERIRSLKTMKFLYIGPEYMARLEAHAKEVEEQQTRAE